MRRLRLAGGVVWHMALYAAGAGSLLGLFYVWIVFLLGVVFGFIIGILIGLIEGLIMAALIIFVLQPLTEVRRYRYVVGAINITIAAVTALWVMYSIVSVVKMQVWDPIVLAVFFAVPALFAGIAAWRASNRVLVWVEQQSTSVPELPS